MEDLLTKVSNILSNLQLQTSQIVPSNPFTKILQHQVTIPPLKLDVPRPELVVGKLLAVGAPYSHALELSRIHCGSCDELAQQYIELYNNTCRSISSSSIDPDTSRTISRLRKLSLRYSATVVSWEEELIDSTMSKIQDREKEQGSSRMKAFNASYLPKLEVFFKINPKPSRADKLYLAKQSGMTLRQINVWFQNHRARGRKVTKKIPTPSPTTSGLSLQEELSARPTVSEEVGSPRQCIHGYTDVVSDSETIPDDESVRQRTTSRSSSWSSSSTLVEHGSPLYSAEDCDPFFKNAPSHSFPTQYPPIIDDAIFPCRFGNFSFPKPVWDRSPDLPKPLSEDNFDMSELTCAFSKLSIHSANLLAENHASRDITTNQWMHNSSSDMASNAVYPYRTFTAPAPLPSFIATPISSDLEKDTRCVVSCLDLLRESSNEDRKQSRSLPNLTAHRSIGFDVSSGEMRKKSLPFVERMPSNPPSTGKNVSRNHDNSLTASYISRWLQEADAARCATLPPLSCNN